MMIRSAIAALFTIILVSVSPATAQTTKAQRPTDVGAYPQKLGNFCKADSQDYSHGMYLCKGDVRVMCSLHFDEKTKKFIEGTAHWVLSDSCPR